MPLYVKIEVFISMIKVEEKYFSFNWRIRINGKPHCNGKYSDDHVWGNDKNKFKQILKEGYAAELALQSLGNIP